MADRHRYVNPNPKSAIQGLTSASLGTMISLQQNLHLVFFPMRSFLNTVVSLVLALAVAISGIAPAFGEKGTTCVQGSPRDCCGSCFQLGLTKPKCCAKPTPTAQCQCFRGEETPTAPQPRQSSKERVESRIVDGLKAALPVVAEPGRPSHSLLAASCSSFSPTRRQVLLCCWLI